LLALIGTSAKQKGEAKGEESKTGKKKKEQMSMQRSEIDEEALSGNSVFFSVRFVYDVRFCKSVQN
jgi:hypothetical protein